MKKLLSILLSAAVVLSVIACCTTSGSARGNYGNGAPYDVSYPTKEQIIQKTKELNIDLSAADTFASEYDTNAPYAPGKMSAESQQNVLNTLNLCRYIAGIPDDVELKDSYCEAAQAAALVNAVNRQLSHQPKQPEGMTDELYSLGCDGARRANLSYGHGTTANTVVEGWMDDSGPSNIKICGHRRWVLNPAMKYTGIGSVGGYKAMYAVDRSRDGSFGGEYIAWPAPNTPIELFSGSVFSVTLGEAYDIPSVDSVNVEVSSQTLGKSWTVNKDHPETSFNVETNSYGIPKCIIFKVADFTQDDVISVRITGITKNGVEAPIEYTANLFTLSAVKSVPKYRVMRPYEFRELPSPIECPINSKPVIRWSSSDCSVADIYYDTSLYSFEEGVTEVTCRYGSLTSEPITVIVSNRDILLGDADGDGAVTVLDVTVIQRRLAQLSVANFREYAADVDRDNDIGVTDATNIQRYLAHASVNESIQTPMQELP